jgi:uncharacterized protein YdbL (DUF1318 family)
MTEKITLEEKIDAFSTIVENGFASMESGFAAVADDITDIKRDMATKDQIIALHTQVNSIETDIRDMKGQKLVTRVADLEEEVFGAARA